ncbi:uncharacterized protein ASPGLDRAFT_585622 [Aspergillus glaucus CBS 516.65]|uniref:Uncharacterized protein n=1 Tax=Aspergillus glaucus CBS 516.65 TaxID=1160497 RepID=A0A1L9VED4_ASPGL|nr:hypothetical protein ASPGLDRAFT_585622 [Aspergillus glaucus CBS 516.65]OJJ82269.1 hypothetical protein ASPGLDRAFT_585622 [Aspergillus glaucus CBS 516.65]
MVRVNNILFALALATGALATSNCQTKYNACRTAPDANMASCAAEHASCTGSLQRRDDTCQTKYNSCRTAPDANMSSCVSDHASSPTTPPARTRHKRLVGLATSLAVHGGFFMIPGKQSSDCDLFTECIYSCA